MEVNIIVLEVFISLMKFGNVVVEIGTMIESQILEPHARSLHLEIEDGLLRHRKNDEASSVL